MQKKKKAACSRICKIIVISMFLVFGTRLCVHAEMEQNNPDIHPETGSIEISLTDGAEGTEKEGVIFAYAKVAELINGEYEAVKKYDAGIDFNKLNTALELESAAERVKEKVKNPDGRVITDANGETEIQNLEMGMYLVYVVDQAKYETVLPFLVSIPTWDEENQSMNYQMHVIPKHEPLLPDTPEAPQTNLDGKQWKYLALAVGSVMLAVLVLCANNRKNKNG